VRYAKLWESFARPLLITPVLALVLGGTVYLLLKLLRLAPDHRTPLLDSLHFLSAGAVGFARGMNDSPKLLALLVGGGQINEAYGLLLVMLFMALGGFISARQVADTLAHKITGMNPGQGFAANLATSMLTTTASYHGLPVSTTHVSVGALLGIGITTKQARWRTIVPVLMAWLITLPCAGLLAAFMWWLVTLRGE
jgi:PiT family inorganic phosphate transporter